MSQKKLAEYESTGVECPVCGQQFKSNKGFGPHFTAKHPEKHPVVERIKRDFTESAEDALRKLHWDREMGLRTISDKFGYPRGGLRDAFDLLGVERRDWKVHHALYRTNYNGYESWRSKDPDGTERLMKVHRLLAIAEFGIDAVRGLDVHHKNGVKWDNRHKNIELMGNSEHLSEHYQEREVDDSGRFV